MDEKKLAQDGKIMRAVTLMQKKGIKVSTIAKTLKIDELDVRAILDTLKKHNK